MIKYSPGIKPSCKSSVNYASRGMSFENSINISNSYYLEKDIAIIYKKPTPIKIVKASKYNNSYRINEAYFMMPSTTDYNGIYKGKYIDFEAKETTSLTSFPLSNIHQNQIDHLKNIVKHGGIGFILINFIKLNKIYLVDFSIIKAIEKIDRKSIPLDLIKKQGYEVPCLYVCPVNYIDIVDMVYFK